MVRAAPVSSARLAYFGQPSSIYAAVVDWNPGLGGPPTTTPPVGTSAHDHGGADRERLASGARWLCPRHMSFCTGGPRFRLLPCAAYDRVVHDGNGGGALSTFTTTPPSAKRESAQPRGRDVGLPFAVSDVVQGLRNAWRSRRARLRAIRTVLVAQPSRSRLFAVLGLFAVFLEFGVG